MFSQTPRVQRSSKKRPATTSRPGTPIGVTIGTPLPRKMVSSPTQKQRYLLQTPELSIQLVDTQIQHLSQNYNAEQTVIIDPISGFAALNQKDQVILWSYKSPFPVSTLPLPTSSNDSSCLSSIIHSSTIGLIAVNADGLLRLWENISLPLQFKQLDLELDGQIISILDCEQVGFLLTLDSGSIIRVTNPSRSKPLTSNYLTRNSITKNLFGLFGSRSNSLVSNDDEIVGVVAGAFEVGKFSRSVFVLTTETLQKWDLTFSCTENLLFVISLQKILAHGDILDFDYGKFNRLVFLVIKDGVYKLVSCEENNGQIEVFDVLGLKCVGDGQPTLQLCNGGPIALICFHDKITIVYLFNDFDFEETVPVKNHLIGCGVDRSKLFQSVIESKSVCAVCLEGKGIIEVECFLQNFIKKEEVHDNREFFQILEQAVFFGGNENDNPIMFDLRDYEGGLDNICLDLSGSILMNTNAHLPNILDEAAYLNESLHRMNEIIKTLDLNGLVLKLSKNARFQLMFNAEKLAAMKQLWNYQDSLYQRNNQEEYAHYIEDSIERFCKKIEPVSIREFFKKMAFHLDVYLCNLIDLKSLNTQNISQNELMIILERGKLFTIVYDAVREYRSGYSELYKNDGRFSVQPWTATTEMINGLQVQFELIVNSIKNMKMTDVIQIDDEFDDIFDDPRKTLGSFLKQLVNLSHHLLSSLNDMKEYSQEIGSNDRVVQEISERYRLIQTTSIESMLKFNLKDEAFNLAETFQDLETLVELTLKHPSKPFRIKTYMQQFGEKFAIALFQNYVNNNQLKELLLCHDNEPVYLSNFLKRESLNHLLWIVEIKTEDYMKASETLWKLNESEPNLRQQELALSLSKLCYIEALDVDDLQQYEKELIKFDSSIDQSTAQHMLYDSFQQYSTHPDPTNQIIVNFYPTIEKVREIYLKMIVTDLMSNKRIKLHQILELLIYQQTKDHAHLLDCLQLLIDHKQDLNTEEFMLVLNLFWLRVWNETFELVGSDNQILDLLKNSRAFKVCEWIYNEYGDMFEEVVVRPMDVAVEFPGFVESWVRLTQDQVKGLQSEILDELNEMKASPDLEKVYSQIIVVLEQQSMEMDLD